MPIALTAATLKVYAVPPVSPVIVLDVAGVLTLTGSCALEPM